MKDGREELECQELLYLGVLVTASANYQFVARDPSLTHQTHPLFHSRAPAFYLHLLNEAQRLGGGKGQIKLTGLFRLNKYFNNTRHLPHMSCNSSPALTTSSWTAPSGTFVPSQASSFCLS